MKLILAMSAILMLGLTLSSQAVARDISHTIKKVLKRATRKAGDAGAEFLALQKIRLKKYLDSELNFDIGFYLYTPSNPEEKYNLQRNPSSLKDSPFDSKLETKFIVHGYTVDLTKESVFYSIKDELLLEGNYNVIVVDWTKYNKGEYTDVSLNLVFIGLEIAKLIQFLTENNGISEKSVHIIGHSFGAHIGGFTGKTICHLGRITGLDAAGSIFQFLPPSWRLYYTDANFVDGIHTGDALSETEGYGALPPYGHLDFFPNGGSQQPGCNFNDIFKYVNGTSDTVTNAFSQVECNHDLVTYMFLESIRNCTFLSVFCRSYSNFLRGECSRGANSDQKIIREEMGFHAQPHPSLRVKSKFFLKTMGESPYCIDQDITKQK